VTHIQTDSPADRTNVAGCRHIRFGPRYEGRYRVLLYVAVTKYRFMSSL